MSIWTRMTRTTMTAIAVGALIAAAGCNKADKESAAAPATKPAPTESAKYTVVPPATPLAGLSQSTEPGRRSKPARLLAPGSIRQSPEGSS